MFIYKITNLINNKVYIGKSKDPDSRWEQHRNAAEKGSDSVFHRAIRKYGEDSFKLEVLIECSGDGSIEESNAIKEYDCCVLDGVDRGYNMTRGGDGFDSETTTHYLNQITAEGRNPFSKGNNGWKIAQENQRKLVESGQHVFQTEKHRETISNLQKRRVAEGIHPLAGEKGSAHSKRVQRERIENGTFHMHQPEMKEHQRKKALEAIANGTHNFKEQHTCPHCSKIGFGPVMTRWHFDKCKKKV